MLWHRLIEALKRWHRARAIRDQVDEIHTCDIDTTARCASCIQETNFYFMGGW